MPLQRLNDMLFIDTTLISFVHFENITSQPAAKVSFMSGASERLEGEAAHALYTALGNGDEGELSQQSSLSPAAPLPSGAAGKNEVSFSDLIQTRPTGSLGPRNKAWYYREIEGRGMILAFVNMKGSSSARLFDAKTGIFQGRHYRSGNYQQQFAGLIEGATALSVPWQPNLERDCKERLPDEILQHLDKQIQSVK